MAEACAAPCALHCATGAWAAASSVPAPGAYRRQCEGTARARSHPAHAWAQRALCTMGTMGPGGVTARRKVLREQQRPQPWRPWWSAARNRPADRKLRCGGHGEWASGPHALLRRASWGDRQRCHHAEVCRLWEYLGSFPSVVQHTPVLGRRLGVASSVATVSGGMWHGLLASLQCVLDAPLPEAGMPSQPSLV